MCTIQSGGDRRKETLDSRGEDLKDLPKRSLCSQWAELYRHVPVTGRWA